MKTNYGITKFKKTPVFPAVKSTQDGEAKIIRGFIPVVAATLLSASAATGTSTVSIGNVIGTNSVAVVLAVRCQDTYSASYAEVLPKASVDSTQRSGFRVFAKDQGGLAKEQGIVPVNSSREVLFTKNQAVQTASVAVVGYYI